MGEKKGQAWLMGLLLASHEGTEGQTSEQEERLTEGLYITPEKQTYREKLLDMIAGLKGEL